MTHAWRPIEPLNEADHAVEVEEIAPLYLAWSDFRDQLEKDNKAKLDEFVQRLERSLAIETGILERIYDLDRGTTTILIEKGFVEDLVARDKSSLPPATLIQILKDQAAAIEMVYDVVSGKRSLTKGFILELHAVVTRHQDSVEALDTYGNLVEVPLLKGTFKKSKNNPTRRDGDVHEYCPPEHVDTEIENLLRWYAEYTTKKADPVILAAWLHHRFTQVHPFQDGNGRVARALLTLVLLKSQLLPIVVDREQRVPYISALEAADQGSLGSLVRLLANLEKRSILQALSLDTTAQVEKQKAFSEAVIASLAAKLNSRQVKARQELLRVNDVARKLRAAATTKIQDTLKELENVLKPLNQEAKLFVETGGSDKESGHWYKYELVELQRQEDRTKWINFEDDHYFVKASIRHKEERLVYVVSFHHVGRSLSGVMEATAFARLETSQVEEESREPQKSLKPSCVEPFVLTWKTDADKISPEFLRWLDASIAVAVKEWGDRL